MESRYPGNRRTWLKFPDGHYSGANLFALRSHKVAIGLMLKRARRPTSTFTTASVLMAIAAVDGAELGA